MKTTSGIWRTLPDGNGGVSDRGYASIDALTASIREESDRIFQQSGQHPDNIAIGLGRVAAHEAGHYFLQILQNKHTGDGLMQTGFSGREWFGPSYRDTFKFSKKQAQQLSKRC